MSLHPCPWCQCPDGTTDADHTTHLCPWCQCPPTPTLEQLARDVLGIDSLDEQGRDSLDFHEVSVVAVRAALAAAYLAGKESAR